MKEIIEHIGPGLLAILTGAATVAIYVSCIRSGGMISNAVAAFMRGICG